MTVRTIREITTIKHAHVAILAALLFFGGMEGANAFCGVIQQSAVGKTVNKARHKANKLANQQIKPLYRQHGKKLVVEAKQYACLGGAVAIDSNGNQVVGNPSCTVTVPFCVNP